MALKHKVGTPDFHDLLFQFHSGMQRRSFHQFAIDNSPKEKRCTPRIPNHAIVTGRCLHPTNRSEPEEFSCRMRREGQTAPRSQCARQRTNPDPSPTTIPSGTPNSLQDKSANSRRTNQNVFDRWRTCERTAHDHSRARRRSPARWKVPTREFSLRPFLLRITRSFHLSVSKESHFASFGMSSE